MDCLLVHGWMVTGRVWDGFAPKLEARTFAPTWGAPTWGAPTWGAPTWGAPADAEPATLGSLASRLLDEAARAGLDRFHLVGHSMGGQLAQLAAAMAPERVRSLVLVNTVPLSGLPLPEEVASAFRASGGDRAAQGAILDQACLELSAAAKEALLDDAGSIDPSWIARTLDLFVAGGDVTRLAAITCPTLVVATDDPFLPPPFLEQAVVSKIAGAKLAVVKGPGHYPQVERPDALATVVRSFLADASK